MIPKILVGAAIALAAYTGTGTASATPVGSSPNPFSALGCSCQGSTSPTGSREVDIRWGMWDGEHS